jgi:hypothetical protein
LKIIRNYFGWGNDEGSVCYCCGEDGKLRQSPSLFIEFFVCQECIQILILKLSELDDYSHENFYEEPIFWLVGMVTLINEDWDILDLWEGMDTRTTFYDVYVGALVNWANRNRSHEEWTQVIQRTKQMYFYHDSDSDIPWEAFRVAIRLISALGDIKADPDIALTLLEIESTSIGFESIFKEMQPVENYTMNPVEVLFMDFDLEMPRATALSDYFVEVANLYPDSHFANVMGSY